MGQGCRRPGPAATGASTSAQTTMARPRFSRHHSSWETPGRMGPSRAAVNMAPPNSVALTRARATYSTRRSGSADAGTATTARCTSRPARTVITPSTSAAWMIRALIAGETGAVRRHLTSSLRDTAATRVRRTSTRATRSLWAKPPSRACRPTACARYSAAGTLAASARLTIIAAMPAIATPAIAPPAMSPLENSTPGPDSTSAMRLRRSCACAPPASA